MRKCQLLKLGLVEYGEAWGIQKQLFNAISQNEIIDTLIILQHPPVYTFGRRTIGRQLLSNKTTMLHVNTKDNENPPSPPFIKGGKGGFSGETNFVVPSLQPLMYYRGAWQLSLGQLHLEQALSSRPSLRQIQNQHRQ